MYRKYEIDGKIYFTENKFEKPSKSDLNKYYIFDRSIYSGSNELPKFVILDKLYGMDDSWCSLKEVHKDACTETVAWKCLRKIIKI